MCLVMFPPFLHFHGCVEFLLGWIPGNGSPIWMQSLDVQGCDLPVGRVAGVRSSFSSLCPSSPAVLSMSLFSWELRQSLYQERYFAQVLTWLKIPEFSIFVLWFILIKFLSSTASFLACPDLETFPHSTIHKIGSSKILALHQIAVHSGKRGLGI